MSAGLVGVEALTVGLVGATRDWSVIWSLIGAAAVLTVLGLLLLGRRR